MHAARIFFLVAASLHAGFQLTVTVLVYPALARVQEQDWSREHALHSARIVPLVGVIYVFLAGSTVWLLASDREGWTWVAAVGALLVAAVTAFGAAPLHGKLTNRDPVLLDRLLRVDRLRAVLAVLLMGIAIVLI